MKQFARVFGNRPCLKNPTHATTDLLQLFSETFGPAQILNWRPRRVLYWNFCDQDGKKSYSLFAQVPRTKLPRTVQVWLSTPTHNAAFREWTATRLAQIQSGDIAPLAIKAHKCVVSQLRQIA